MKLSDTNASYPSANGPPLTSVSASASSRREDATATIDGDVLGHVKVDEAVVSEDQLAKAHAVFFFDDYSLEIQVCTFLLSSQTRVISSRSKASSFVFMITYSLVSLPKVMTS